MDITGIIKVKNNEQQVSEKFKKREFVLTDNSSQYPQHIQFQLTQDRCSLLDSYNVGDQVKVYFNLRGREWNDPKTNSIRYFNSLEAWKLERVGANAPQATANEPIIASGPQDDLPF